MGNQAQRVRSELAINDLDHMLLQFMVQHMPGYIHWKNVDLEYAGCNYNFARLAGVNSPDDIIGVTDQDLNWSFDAERFRNEDMQVIQTGLRMASEQPLPIKRHDGNTTLLRTEKFPLYDKAYNVIGVLGTSVDITDHRIALESTSKLDDLADTQARLQATMQTISRQLHELSNEMDTMIQSLQSRLRNTHPGCECQKEADNIAEKSAFLRQITEAFGIFSTQCNDASFSLPTVAKELECV